MSDRITSTMMPPMVPLMIDWINAGAQDNADLRQQPVGDERADDADDDVAQQSEAGAAHDQPGEPACNGSDEKCCKNSHSIILSLGRRDRPVMSSFRNPELFRAAHARQH